VRDDKHITMSPFQTLWKGLASSNGPSSGEGGLSITTKSADGGKVSRWVCQVEMLSLPSLKRFSSLRRESIVAGNC
jgi:hypothetical protein